jgi:hypothetical protein
MRLIYGLIAGLLVIAAAQRSTAATIWDNGGPSSSVSDILSDISLPGFGSNQVGDNFILGTSATLTQVQWSGLYGSNVPGADDFFIRFFTISGGVPVMTAFLSFNVGSVGRSDSGLDDSVGLDIYNYTATIPNTLLAPGDYLVSIVNDTNSDPNGDKFWYWTASSANGSSWSRASQGDDAVWSSLPVEFAFKIDGFASSGTVPEGGATLPFLAAGLTFLIVAAQTRLLVICRLRPDH